ncbi:hypothetical protein NDU88_002028 [Pleurodeles waltl]|uniref:Uncharacterized protein n=1 Tax=Pleurodeles waltl TaxID=8319 RepID=A0AAV7TK00_PLEWA|nr:hypothetical protein NDU88_002028 [Pleurodeles waltl]
MVLDLNNLDNYSVTELKIKFRERGLKLINCSPKCEYHLALQVWLEVCRVQATPQELAGHEEMEGDEMEEEEEGDGNLVADSELDGEKNSLPSGSRTRRRPLEGRNAERELKLQLTQLKLAREDEKGKAERALAEKRLARAAESPLEEQNHLLAH